jgi:hypothetical protein
MASAITSEEKIQHDCILWFDMYYPQHRQMLFHVDNNSWNATIGARKKAMGVRPGVSDLILVGPRRVYFLECKNDRGEQSNHQISFEEKVISRGQIYIVFRSLTEFKQIIWQVIGRSLIGEA